MGTYFGHKPTKFKTTETRFNLGEETDQAPLSVGWKKHSSSRSIHTRKLETAFILKRYIKVDNKPTWNCEIRTTKDSKKDRAFQLNLQWRFCNMSLGIHKSGIQGYNLKMQLIFKTKSQKLVKICEVFLKYRLGISNIHVYS